MTNEDAARILEYPVLKWSTEWDDRKDGLSYCEAMVMLPIGITIGFNPGVKFYVTFLVNFLVHAVTDNGKANAMKLNLVQDQAIHILQILVTFLVFHL